jgi:biotin operon repressor
MPKSKEVQREYRNLAEQKAFMDKIESLLKDNEYLFAKQLASKCGVSVGTISKYIRKMREKGIGIHSTKKGYILSEFASRKDDTGFIRRLLGRRLSDHYAATAAKPHIMGRRTGATKEYGVSIGLAFSSLGSTVPTRMKDDIEEMTLQQRKLLT